MKLFFIEHNMMFHYYDFYSKVFKNQDSIHILYPEMFQGDHHSIFEGFDVKIER